MGIFDFLFSQRASADSFQVSAPTPESMTIVLTESEWKKEDKKYKQLCELVKQKCTESGWFTQNGITAIYRNLKEAYRRGGRFSFNALFPPSNLLSLEEKRHYGINTRIKIPRLYFECLSNSGIHQENPKELLENIFHQASGIISRQESLNETRKLGIKFVKILPAGDERDCMAIKKWSGRIPIDEAPELPLPECNSSYCRCVFVADQHDWA